MIWLIGGTSESREIAQLFSQLQMDYLVTVTTPEARALYTNLDAIVRVGPLNTDALVQLIEQYHITCIVDASHPHAQLISQQAIDSQIPYLRYERLQVLCPTGSRLEVKNIDSLIQGNYLEGQRVLFTIGYKGLARFRSFQSKATLFTRILPSLTALTAALEAGFTSDRIIALRPPVNRELEKALWLSWKIETVITKASGPRGGEDIKQQLAQELQVKLIVLARPSIQYPQQTNELKKVVSFCLGER